MGWSSAASKAASPEIVWCRSLFPTIASPFAIPSRTLTFCFAICKLPWNTRTGNMSRCVRSTWISAVLARGLNLYTQRHTALHILDLRPDLNEVSWNLDKDSVQRRVGRAEHCALTEKCGRSDDLLKEFYALLLTTRRRKRLPPIPCAWFRNLAKHQTEALEVRLAYEDRTPVAGILTLRYRNTVYYRYGCCDSHFDEREAVTWLLWKAIAAAKSNGASEFDMGPTEVGNAGVLALENHWDSHSQKFLYWKFPGTSSPISEDNWKLRIATRMFSHMPGRLLSITGNLMYRHIG